jgi:hypothetical protein
MRKVTLALTFALCLVFTFAFGASALYVQMKHIAMPDASGGGCSGLRGSAYGDMSGSACISWQSPNALPDGYINFKPPGGHNGVYSCIVYLYVDRNGSYWNSTQYDCTNAAKSGQRNVHYGPLATYVNSTNSGTYTSNLFVDLKYADNFTTTLDTYNSPGLQAP